MGPAAGPLAEAEPAAREAAIAAMRDELARHQRGGAVVLPGATWLVRAQVG